MTALKAARDDTYANKVARASMEAEDSLGLFRGLASGSGCLKQVFFNSSGCLFVGSATSSRFRMSLHHPLVIGLRCAAVNCDHRGG